MTVNSQRPAAVGWRRAGDRREPAGGGGRRPATAPAGRRPVVGLDWRKLLATARPVDLVVPPPPTCTPPRAAGRSTAAGRSSERSSRSCACCGRAARRGGSAHALQLVRPVTGTPNTSSPPHCSIMNPSTFSTPFPVPFAAASRSVAGAPPADVSSPEYSSSSSSPSPAVPLLGSRRCVESSASLSPLRWRRIRRARR